MDHIDCPSQDFLWKVNEWCVLREGDALALTTIVSLAMLGNLVFVFYLLRQSCTKRKKIVEFNGHFKEVQSNGTYCILSYFLLVNAQVMLVLLASFLAVSSFQFILGPKYQSVFISQVTVTCSEYKQSGLQIVCNLLIYLITFSFHTMVLF